MSANERVGSPVPPSFVSPGTALLRDAVATLSAERYATSSDVVRLTALRELWPQVCALYGQVAERIGDIHVRGAAADDGFASTHAFLRNRLRLDGPAAARLIRVGCGLTDLVATHTALAAGEISVDHADAIRQIAADLGEKTMAGGEMETILLEYARTKTPNEVRRLGRLIAAHLASNEEAEERQVRLHQGRWLTANTTFDGMIHIEGMLDPIAGAQLLAVLAAYMPGPDPDNDRTPRQRRADALADIIAVALANKDRSLTGDEKPNITVTVSLETLLNQLADPTPTTGTDTGPDPSAGPDPGAGPDPSAGPDSGADGDNPVGCGESGPADDAGDNKDTARGDDADDRGAENRWATNLRPPPTSRPNGDNPNRDSPLVTSPAEAARRYLTDYLRPGGPALLSPGFEPISAETARRLACDASIIPIVLGSRSEPLDIGRASRTVPLPMRRAVELRDVHCRFPGCDRPAKWCEPHHVRFWVRDNGPTAINNLILQCKFHHVCVHEYGWVLTFDPVTGTVTATRPDGTPHDIVSTRAGPAP